METIIWLLTCMCAVMVLVLFHLWHLRKMKNEHKRVIQQMARKSIAKIDETLRQHKILVENKNK